MSARPAPSPAVRKNWLLGVGAFAVAALTAGVVLGAPAEDHSTAVTDRPPALSFGAPSFGVPGKAAAVHRTIRITARDDSFDVQSLTVNVGETVRFVVANEGAADHEFTLADAAAQAGHRREMAEMAGMGGGHAQHGGSNTVFLKSGETKELVWRFGAAGLVEFACNVPGHYEAGMKGVVAIL